LVGPFFDRDQYREKSNEGPCRDTGLACLKYLKATSEAQKATKQAIRDWKQNLDRKASAEFFSKGTLALEGAMDSEIRSDLDRLKECLAKIR